MCLVNRVCNISLWVTSPRQYHTGTTGSSVLPADFVVHVYAKESSCHGTKDKVDEWCQIRFPETTNHCWVLIGSACASPDDDHKYQTCRFWFHTIENAQLLCLIWLDKNVNQDTVSWDMNQFSINSPPVSTCSNNGVSARWGGSRSASSADVSRRRRDASRRWSDAAKRRKNVGGWRRRRGGPTESRYKAESHCGESWSLKVFVSHKEGGVIGMRWFFVWSEMFFVTWYIICLIYLRGYNHFIIFS